MHYSGGGHVMSEDKRVCHFYRNPLSDGIIMVLNLAIIAYSTSVVSHVYTDCFFKLRYNFSSWSQLTFLVSLVLIVLFPK